MPRFAAAATMGSTWRRRTFATSTRSRPTPKRCLRSYRKVLLPEMNLGQLALLLRGRFLVDVISYNQVRGLPFKAAELASVIEEVATSD